MKKVLFIDDDIDTEQMESIIDILLYEGIKVTPISDLEYLQKNMVTLISEHDLIVLDILMPPQEAYSLDDSVDGSITGLLVLKDIRDKFQNIPIIILSVKQKFESQNELSKYNINAILEKPVRAFELIKEINNI